MNFRIPQNIDVEDRILSFLTMRQLIILVVGGMVEYLLFTIFQGYGLLNPITIGIMIIIFCLVAGIAFVRINFLPFHWWFVMVLEGVMVPRVRYWNNRYSAGQYFSSSSLNGVGKQIKKNSAGNSEKNYTNFEDILLQLGEGKKNPVETEEKFFTLKEEDIHDFSRFK